MAEDPETTHAPSPEPAPRSLLRGLTTAFGIVALLASLWAGALQALLAGSHDMVLSHADGYKPAEFKVEKLVYSRGRRQGNRSSPTRYWAEGTINGKPERFFGLGSYLPKTPGSQVELESMMKIGRVLPVLYNPEVPDTIEVRVLYPAKDFPAKWQLRRRNMYKVGFGPLAVSLGLCLLCSLAARSWTGLKFAVASIPFPLMGWIFAWLDRSA